MPEEEGAQARKVSVKSRTYFLLTMVFVVAGAAGLLLGIPLLFGAAALIALFLVAGGFYSLANERGWMD